MASTIVAPTAAARAVERRDIHLSACRYRRQGLVCSTCSELTIRVGAPVQIAEAA